MSILDIIPHPHHQSLEDRLFIRNIDVIAGEQLNNFSCGEQQELLVLNDLEEVFLEHCGDAEETDNHQLLAEEYAWCSILCVSVYVSTSLRSKWHKDREVKKNEREEIESASLEVFISNNR